MEFTVKNPTYGRHWISWRVRTVAPIQKKLTKIACFSSYFLGGGGGGGGRGGGRLINLRRNLEKLHENVNSLTENWWQTLLWWSCRKWGSHWTGPYVVSFKMVECLIIFTFFIFFVSWFFLFLFILSFHDCFWFILLFVGFSEFCLNFFLGFSFSSSSLNLGFFFSLRFSLLLNLFLLFFFFFSFFSRLFLFFLFFLVLVLLSEHQLPPPVCQIF